MAVSAQAGEQVNRVLLEWERRMGRPLRVLHIGNIANNAYNNAKVQRAFGIDADVVCYEYYHVMGCPEWEDADFDGDVVDPFYPDWWNVDLHGFRRPRWFVQGRLRTCQRYVLARSEGKRFRTRILWRRLRAERWLRCRSTVTAYTLAALLGVIRGDPAVVLAAWRIRLVTWRIRVRVVWTTRKTSSYVRNIAHTAARKTVAAARALVLILRTGDVRTAGLTVFPRRLARIARTPAQHELVTRAFAVAGGEPGATVEARIDAVLQKFMGEDTEAVEEATDALLSAAGNAPMSADIEALAESVLLEYTDAEAAHSASEIVTEILVEDEWALRFHALFPDRTPPLTRVDYETYLPTLPLWEAIFEHYDIVQGYSSDPIIPLLARHPAFTAYEHGTLREIPFEDSARGRICALAYREAPVVFVTNSDVLSSARRLGLTESQLVFLPHAVDSGKLFRFADANASLAPKPGQTPTLFSPSRQDWLANDPNYSKGNDRLLHGLRIALDRGASVRLVLVSWGRDLDASRALIAELALDDVVEWVPPMKKSRLWERYLGAHAVVDQFLTPAIGGVTFEAIALGRRVISALDTVTAAKFFGESPPIFSCESAEEIADAIEEIAADLDDTAGRGDALRRWFSTYHSAERIVELQVGAYARLLATAEPALDDTGN